jgi:hypothetical protein
MAKKTQVMVSLDKEQIDWIKKKEEEGYSRPGLIRYAVKRLMTEQSTPSQKPQVRQEEEKPAKVEEEPPKKYELEQILGAMLHMEAELNKINPKAVELVKDMQAKLKNIDYMSPRAAFELGIFKVEMEEIFNRKMAEHVIQKEKE